MMNSPGRNWGENENLTLSEAELRRCDPITAEGGRVLRAFCPFHGSDKQRSLRVKLDTGHFKCFACDAWGYLDTAREHRRDTFSASLQLQSGMRRPVPRQTPRPAPARATQPPPAPTPRPELDELMARYRAALPGSPGEAYLAERRIPLDVAQRAGVGYAAPGTWGNPSRDWQRGRLVFPHTDPAGAIVNLYGRAVGDAPKSMRHDHLPGAKGYFNAQALREGVGPVMVCEGAFDALALMAAGGVRVVAIFGVNGWRWDWARDVRELIFALDTDETGQKGFRELAPVARLRGKRVAYLEPEAYGGEKDAAAAWSAGTLQLADWETLDVSSAPSPPAPAPRALPPQDNEALVETPAGTRAPATDADPFEGEPWAPDVWEASANASRPGRQASPLLESLGDASEALHERVRMEGERIVLSGLDRESRHRVMCALIEYGNRYDRAALLTETRHNYKGGTLTMTPPGEAARSALAIIMSRTLKEPEGIVSES